MKKLESGSSLRSISMLAMAGALAVSMLVTVPRMAGAMPLGHNVSWVHHHHDRDNDDQVYYGRVTLVSSDTAFNVDINGRVYNVYTDETLPYNLGSGSHVRIVGDREGSDDIDNATVEVLDND